MHGLLMVKRSRRIHPSLSCHTLRLRSWAHLSTFHQRRPTSVAHKPLGQSLKAAMSIFEESVSSMVVGESKVVVLQELTYFSVHAFAEV